MPPRHRFDIAQIFSTGKLGESHTHKLVKACERAYTAVVFVTVHTLTEFVLGQKIHDLRQDYSSFLLEHPQKGDVTWRDELVSLFRSQAASALNSILGFQCKFFNKS